MFLFWRWLGSCEEFREEIFHTFWNRWFFTIIGKWTIKLERSAMIQTALRRIDAAISNVCASSSGVWVASDMIFLAVFEQTMKTRSLIPFSPVKFGKYSRNLSFMLVRFAIFWILCCCNLSVIISVRFCNAKILRPPSTSSFMNWSNIFSTVASRFSLAVSCLQITS